MKKLGIVLALLAVLLFSPPVMAEPELSPWKDSIGILGKPTRSWRTSNFDSLVVNTSLSASVVRYFQLPLTSFLKETGGSTGSTVGSGVEPLTASTVPGMEIDDKVAAIVWADGELSAVVVTFRVPGDYVLNSHSGAFKVSATASADDNPNEMDFDVYVNSSGVAADTTATNQTPVAFGSSDSSLSEITLRPADDFVGLAAGNWVTLRLWREDDDQTGTDDLELKGVVFYYTGTQ